MNCPKCGSNLVIKYGFIHSNKQRFMCEMCGRQCVENPQNKIISSDIRKMIDNLLLERVSRRGIVRVTGVSLKWLQSYVKKKLDRLQLKVTSLPNKGTNLSII